MKRSLVTLLLLTAPATVHASPAEARRLFVEATQALDAADFPRAIELYQRSFAAHPNSGAVYGLARAQRAMRRHADALVSLERYLRVAGPRDRPSPDEVRREIAELRRLIGTIELRGLPRGARVELDGEHVGTAPLAAPILAAPGRHVLTVALRGHVTHVEQVDVGAGDTRPIHVRLVRRDDLAAVNLTARPDATVSIDGVQVGETPLPHRVRPGLRVFRFAREGYHTRDLSVTLAPGQRRSLHADLFEDSVWTHPVFWTLVAGLLIGGAIAGGYAIWWSSLDRLHGNLDEPVVQLLRTSPTD